ncbi:Stearoyl-CoA 9-desaturase [Gloeothece citriformis PCC 7424]|uniref:Stearoyl-CoA 9-desaturase n=1 Tax=Gloeothece citriformis (strain PCC 7424) TaxID=65393 RepID=B7KE48_GLOC7|nr:fatty acid desaturase [Gloeothece citriformis]ACK71746.1 Stearoyl-CoA 9-desaturase [Gloeothece citriformis PCC 7424]
MTVSTSAKLPLDWSVIIYMATIHLVALLAFLPSNFNWGAVTVAFILYVVTAGFGITLGFHRLVTHRSFQTPKWLEYILVFCGTIACQGGPIHWVGLHRMHHKYSDTELDPHDSNKGFWWSHLGWMLHNIPADQEIPRYTQDISDDPFYQFCQKNLIPIQVALGLLLFALGGWPFVIWGIFVRLVVVFHCTWFVNSATHKFGYQSHESKDLSKNCWWVALVTFGEGWHNNHHAYQYSARHGLEWWEIDLTWMFIRTLQILGLATNIKLAPKNN